MSKTMPLTPQSRGKTPSEFSTATLDNSLRNLKASSSQLPDLFEEFLDRVNERFSLRRAILFTSHTDPSRIISLAMWNHGELSTGVAITIPSEDSLLDELIEANCAKIISPVTESPGNFIESRLLLDHPGGSLAIYPMVDDTIPVGAICLVSDAEDSFLGNGDFLKNAIQIFTELTRSQLPRYETLGEI